MKYDKRFDHVRTEFGILELGKNRFMEALAAAMQKDMSTLFPLTDAKTREKKADEQQQS